MKHVLETVAGFGMELTDRQIEQFQKYRSGVLEWNEKVNLTAITDPEEFEIKHFQDSIAAAGDPVMQRAKTVIDVGTGGGFPGIPLKILYPDMTDSWEIMSISSIESEIAKSDNSTLTRELMRAVNR